MDSILFLAAAGGAAYFITMATEEPPKPTPGNPTGSNNAFGQETKTLDDINAQEAKERGFIGPGYGQRRASSILSFENRTLDANIANTQKFSQYKQAIQTDTNAYRTKSLDFTLDHAYQKPIQTTRGTKVPLIGLPHAGAEVRSGMNMYKGVNILSTNPNTYHSNAKPESRINNNSGYLLASSYGGASSGTTFEYNNETKMSWAGLQNPWNIGGIQRRATQSVPLDKDQLRSRVPLAHPANVFGADGRATSVVAPPPQMKRTTTVFNRPVRRGKGQL